MSTFGLGHMQVMQALQVDPELGAGAEEARQPQGAVSGDRASAVQDRGHAVGGDLDAARERRRAHVQRPKFFSQVLARVNRRRRHVTSVCRFDELHVRRPGRSLRPFKTDAPLLVDADRVLPNTISFECL